MPDEKPENPEAEYDKEFDKLSAGKEPESKQETPAAAEDKKGEEPPAEDAKQPKQEPKQEEEPPAEEPEKGETPKAEDKGEDAGVQKALKDTKAWATRLAQENAEYKRIIAKFEAGKASGKEVDDAGKGIEKTKSELASKVNKVYEDYPELKDVLDPLISMADTLSTKFNQMEEQGKQERERAEMRSFFEKEVEPKVLEKHPDFGKIKTDEAFFAWAEKQRPSLRTAAMYSLDPDDLIFAVGEYKKFLGTPAAGSLKEEQDKKKAGVRQNLSSMSGTGSKPPLGGKGAPSRIGDVDKEDYDTAFEVAQKELKR